MQVRDNAVKLTLCLYIVKIDDTYFVKIGSNRMKIA